MSVNGLIFHIGINGRKLKVCKRNLLVLSACRDLEEMILLAMRKPRQLAWEK